ncbi:Eisosome component PIL1-domain-containing protein [Melampsora americana]|nr:Eisosome component PIL1-domain-containing protein [Melampsora americana]
MVFHQLQSALSNSNQTETNLNQSNHPTSTNPSKRNLFSNYLSSLTDSITEKATLTNLRQVQTNYDPRQSPYTIKLQRLINSTKTLVQQTDSIGRQSHRTSQSIFTWAQDQSGSSEDLDLVDVGDRLAFLIYKTGDLFLDYSKMMEKSRIELKEIRNFENELTKARDRKKFLENQIQKYKQDVKNKSEIKERMKILNQELILTDQELCKLESSLSELKRIKLKSTYSIQFKAMRELGEKFSILAGFGDLLLNEIQEIKLDSVYDGQERTAWIRGTVAESLVTYRAPLIELPKLDQIPISPVQQSSSTLTSNNDLLASIENKGGRDTRLFGETHRLELEKLLQTSDELSPTSTQPKQTKDLNPMTNTTTTKAPYEIISQLPFSMTGEMKNVNEPIRLPPSFPPPELPSRSNKSKPHQIQDDLEIECLNQSINKTAHPSLVSTIKPLSNYSRPSSSSTSTEIRRIGSNSNSDALPNDQDPNGTQEDRLPAYKLTHEPLIQNNLT